MYLEKCALIDILSCQKQIYFKVNLKMSEAFLSTYIWQSYHHLYIVHWNDTDAFRIA